MTTRDERQLQLQQDMADLRNLGTAIVGKGRMVEIERIIDDARAAAFSMLLDDGRLDPVAVTAAAVNSPAGEALTMAIVTLVVSGDLTRDQRDLIAAVMAVGMVRGPDDRRALARIVGALLDLEHKVLVVLKSLAVPFAGDPAWRVRHASQLEEPARVSGLARLAGIGLVDGDKANELGRSLVRALGKVRR